VRSHGDSDSAADRRRACVSSVADLVTKAFVFQTDESGKLAKRRPRGHRGRGLIFAREALIEMVAEADEKLMEKFFEAGR
jgi:hypothetical protein